jgi:hypothetical protein
MSETITPPKSKNAIKIHIAALRRLAKNEQLQPSRRLYATLVCMYVEGLIPLSMVERPYGIKSNVQWTDRGDTSANGDVKDTAARKEAQEVLKKMSNQIFGGDEDDGSVD